MFGSLSFWIQSGWEFLLCFSDGDYSMNGWISLLTADGDDSPVPNEVGT